MHQPVDNLKNAVDTAVEKCYAPLFETLCKYPEFKFSLHCSGWLFEKLKKDYTDVFENIKKCGAEIFTGGFYEPVLSVIPEEDIVSQIEKLNVFIKRNFGFAPTGMWLAERVWEEGIVPNVVKSGVRYVVLDDFHFKTQGIEPEGYYITEKDGHGLYVFPISKKLRYKIPFSAPAEAVDAVLAEKMPVMFDDAEKFGLWPSTYEWVYGKKWLEEFIQRVLEKLQTYRFFEYIKRFSPSGLVYFPEVSYEEMQEWCLDTDTSLKSKSRLLCINGVFRNFFRKYKESNHLHKRMLEMSGKKSESLYKLQTNDVYWHGVFGGIYLPNLRDNAYRHLIECENGFEDGVKIYDVDFDGCEEIKVKNENLILIFNKNGELIEFDDRKNRFNFLNTLKRRKEAYHFENDNDEKKDVFTIHEIKPSLGKLKSELFFDRYFRYSFIDHLIRKIDGESFKKDEYEDFFLKDFKRNGLDFVSLQIEKRFWIRECINFEIINKTDYDYMAEFNFHFADYENLEEGENYIYDPFTKRKIVFDFDYDEKFAFYVKTVSRDEKGFSATIQCLGLGFVFKNKKIKGRICLK